MPKKRRTINQHMAEKNEILKTALHHLKNKETKKDEADIYAEGWAVSFMKLSPMQKIYAKKAMDEILILGQLEQLRLNSVSTTLSSASSRTSFPCVVPLQSSLLPSASTRTSTPRVIPIQSSSFVSHNHVGNEAGSRTYSTFEDLFSDCEYTAESNYNDLQETGQASSV